ncbi:hypothetical protein HG535_0G04330 [Zygotorulaspora mrakii]|uniref:Uncharacterized protein n=1 Tax=Zygotorulaspora mrakii TaxID=42260 RepID=A0A7H9B7N6_ZYGMR|nr:uncharacterized protein HG535_0G04330 [Zygotorulaspora mrakii]QLG74550.1 hypothetical protein HG535_0G04330 [Zygotorulaspora mrakii]
MYLFLCLSLFLILFLLLFINTLLFFVGLPIISYQHLDQSSITKMFYSRVLRFSASTVARAAKPQGQAHIGESWAITEAKRLVPAVAGWSAFIAVCLGWPLACSRMSVHYKESQLQH